MFPFAQVASRYVLALNPKRGSQLNDKKLPFSVVRQARQARGARNTYGHPQEISPFVGRWKRQSVNGIGDLLGRQAYLIADRLQLNQRKPFCGGKLLWACRRSCPLEDLPYFAFAVPTIIIIHEPFVVAGCAA
jgi:hypothetical protein